MTTVDPEERADIYGSGETFDVVLRRFSRRRLLQGGAAAAVAAVAAPLVRGADRASTANANGAYAAQAIATRGDSGALGFVALAPSTADEWRIAPGHVGNVLIGWGDPLFAGDAPKDPRSLTPGEQERRFGYNCDYIAFVPFDGATSETRGLLWVNHEYTEGKLMFPGYDPEAPSPTRDQVLVELFAHGASVLEVERRGTGWAPVLTSRNNRRITGNTPMVLTGPAAGHRLLRTSVDPSGGAQVLGMLNNCGGGVTPWGTVLTAEENFNQYFAHADAVADATLKSSYARYGLPEGESERRWEQHIPRFDLRSEPNEANRFGWIVEVDPFDPTDVPRKRTALGRFKHEAATVVLANDGRAVVYTGDDERFDYVYKFVTANRANLRNRRANRDLLDSGTLYVAKFNDDGSGQWIAVDHADPRLAAAFDSQGEVLIRCREAADLLGATKMDRPEDIETNPVNKRVYLAMTNNTRRGTAGEAGIDMANPRAENKYGHVIELTEDGDPAAVSFRWGVFLLCGPTGDPSRKMAELPPEEMVDVSCPDNLAFDHFGNLWIATDGQPGTTNQNDALYGLPTEGPDRGRLKRFSTVPPGAECTGPFFTPQSTSLFLAVQHPGERGDLNDPQSVWPDYTTGMPRPSVVWVTKPDGNPRVGS